MATPTSWFGFCDTSVQTFEPECFGITIVITFTCVKNIFARLWPQRAMWILLLFFFALVLLAAPGNRSD